MNFKCHAVRVQSVWTIKIINIIVSIIKQKIREHSSQSFNEQFGLIPKPSGKFGSLLFTYRHSLNGFLFYLGSFYFLEKNILLT